MREWWCAVYRTNAKEVLKLSLPLPLKIKSWENVCSANIIYIGLLSIRQPALTYLKDRIESMDDLCSQCKAIKTMDLAKQPAKGIYHLQYLSLCLTKYWRNQCMLDLDAQLPKANALMKKIESSENWEQHMSCALEASLRIPEMRRRKRSKF